MGVSRNSVDKVRNAVNPLDIIREAVPTLKQAGIRWRGLCPFHNERTPSFYFMPDKGLWHCFGSCNEGGDVFKFLMRLENLTFPEALRQLAQRAGVVLEFDGREGEAVSRETQERERLVALLSEAAAFYNEALRKSADGEPARRHLAKRRIRPETIEKFQLGYASKHTSFLDAALKKGRPIEDLTKAGLAVRSEKTGRYHDPLYDRLVFPITDAYGRVVAFGGRVLDDEAGPKYLNSPETPVYTKGRHLYGLFHGRAGLRARGQAMVVEGYMDVIGCHQAGADYAVAPLGTAFTKEQGQLLKRYVQEVVLLFDPDAAGTKASWRSADVLLREDLFVRVAQVAEGKDPDELILEKGVEALDATLKAAKDVVDFWLDSIAEKAQHHDGLHERVRQAQELLVFLKGVPNEMLRREWVRKISRRLSLDEGSLAKEFSKLADAAPRGAAPAGAAAQSPAPSGRERRSVPRVRSLEEEIIQLLCNHPETWSQAGDLGTTLFNDLRCRGLFEKLKAQWTERHAIDAASIAGDLAREDSGWFTGLLAEEKTFDDPHDTIALRFRRLREEALKREWKALSPDVAPMLDGRSPRDEAKLARYQELTRALKGAAAKAETKPI